MISNYQHLSEGLICSHLCYLCLRECLLLCSCTAGLVLSCVTLHVGVSVSSV